MSDRTTTSPPLTLDYDNPRAAPRGRRLPPFSLPVFLCTGSILFLGFWVIDLVIPRMETLYKDFGLKLPPATQMLLDVARNLVQFRFAPALALPVVVALLVPHLVPGTRPNQDDTTARGRRLLTWAIALLLVNLVTFVVFVIIAITLWLPMMNLMNNIAAQSAGK